MANNIIRGDAFCSSSYGIIKLGIAPSGSAHKFGIGTSEESIAARYSVSSSLYLYSNKSVNIKSGSIIVSAHTTQASINGDEPIFEIGWKDSSNIYHPSWFITNTKISSSQRSTSQLLGTEADAANAIGSVAGSSEYYTTAGSKLFSVVNGTGSYEHEREYVDYFGNKTICKSDYTGSTTFKYWTELVTIAAAATTDTANTIEAGALVYGVSVRVITDIPTATSFKVGISTDDDKWGFGLPVAATTTNITGSMMAGMEHYNTATAIRITPSAVPAAATGQVRVECRYIMITPPQA